MKKSLILLILLFVAAGCVAETAVFDPTLPAATEITPTDLPAPVVETAVATEVVVVVETAVSPTNVPEPTAEPEAIAFVVESGRTPEGAYFLGSPEAPLTLIDYSDFL